MGWQLIQSQSLSASAASVTFSNIPQTYKSLKILVSARDDLTTSGANNNVTVSINSSSANGTSRELYGTGTAAGSGTMANVKFNYIASTGGGATPGTVNSFSNGVMDLPNYSNTTYNKPISSESVSEANVTATFQAMNASLWSQTSAITSITFTPSSSANFVFGSTFTLYGLA